MTSLHPSEMIPGHRQQALDFLALRVSMLGRSKRDLNFYNPYPWSHENSFFSLHPVYVEAKKLLSERLRIISDFDFSHAEDLLTSNPAFFSEADFNLAVRAIWKSDRVGFHKGGNDVFRDGFLSKMIRQWDKPLDGLLPVSNMKNSRG